MAEVKQDKKGRLALLYCLSEVLGSVCCPSGNRVWSCNKYSGESSSGWGKVLGEEQIIQKKKSLRGCSGSRRVGLRKSRCLLKDKLMLKGIIS